MKNKIIAAAVLCIIVLAGIWLLCLAPPPVSAKPAKPQKTVLKIDYNSLHTGQLPGSTPVLFAPGNVSTRYHEHGAPVFSPDGSELFYTLACEHGHVIMHMKNQNGKWTKPQPAPFSGKYSDDGAAFSADGKRLYFHSKRPLDEKKDGKEKKDYDIWYVYKKDGQWEQPRRLNVNSDKMDTHPTLTSSGMLYFMSDRAGGKGGGDIYRAEPAGTGFANPRNLGSTVNSSSNETGVFISPDERYLLFASDRADSLGMMDIFLCFKESSGKWGEVRVLGNIVNMRNKIQRFPEVSPDGKYFFFTSQRPADAFKKGTPLSDTEKHLTNIEGIKPVPGKGNIYWMDAGIIDYAEKNNLDLVDAICDRATKKHPTAAINLYKELKQKHSRYYLFDEYLLIAAGYRLIREKKGGMAMVLLENNTQYFPKSPEAASYLGECYQRVGLLAEAGRAYRAALKRAEAIPGTNITMYKHYVMGIENHLRRVALEKNFPVLKGKYLGEKPPGKTITHFAPRIIFNGPAPGYYFEMHGSLYFSPKGDELLYEDKVWDRLTEPQHATRIVYMKIKDGKWTAPVPAAFMKGSRDGTPAFSPDGQQVFFASHRHVSGNDKKEESNIWVVEHDKKGGFNKWTEPRYLGGNVNSPDHEDSCPAVTGDGTIYFYRRVAQEKGSGQIFVSRFVNGAYTKAEPVGPGVNTPDYEFFPAISPGGKTLTFNRMVFSDFKRSGVYVSFLKKDRTWTTARRVMDNMDTQQITFSHSFSPDRKYLFLYYRYLENPEKEKIINKRGIYWVDAGILGKNRTNKKNGREPRALCP